MKVLLLLILAFLAAAYAAWKLKDARRSDSRPQAEAATVRKRKPVDGECCGQHEVCERESLLAAVSRKIEYYDDEELDTFSGRAPETYLPAEEEAFREVLYTMRDEDVPGWLRSLQLRQIALPPSLKDEALLIVAELRQNPLISD